MHGDAFGENYVDGSDIRTPAESHQRGLPAWPIEATVEARGLNRGIEQDSLRGFLLYIGTDAEPDFTAAPEATATSLPFEVELEDGLYRIVVRARNGYGVTSENTASTLVNIGSGETTEAPPGPVLNLRATVAGYRLRILAEYLEEPGRETPIRFRVTVVQSGQSNQVFTPATAYVTVDGRNLLVDGTAALDQEVTLAESGSSVTVTVRAESATQNGATASLVVSIPGGTIAEQRGYLADSRGAWQPDYGAL